MMQYKPTRCIVPVSNNLLSTRGKTPHLFPSNTQVLYTMIIYRIEEQFKLEGICRSLLVQLPTQSKANMKVWLGCSGFCPDELWIWRQRSHNLGELTVTMPYYPHQQVCCCLLFPQTQLKFPLLQHVAVASSPFSVHLCWRPQQPSSLPGHTADSGANYRITVSFRLESTS